VREIEDEAVVERKNVREMFARYRQGTADYNGGEKRLLDVEAEQVASKEAETRPQINASDFASEVASDTDSEAKDEATQERVREKFAQYKPEQSTPQPPIVRKDGDEQRKGFWGLFASGDPQRAVEYNTARFVAKEIVRLCLGPKAAQSVAFDPESITVEDVLAEISRLSGPVGWALIQRKSGYIAHSS
jgi:hypothetical protein